MMVHRSEGSSDVSLVRDRADLGNEVAGIVRSQLPRAEVNRPVLAVEGPLIRFRIMDFGVLAAWLAAWLATSGLRSAGFAGYPSRWSAA